MGSVFLRLLCLCRVGMVGWVRWLMGLILNLFFSVLCVRMI